MIEVYYAEDDETIGKSVKEYLEQQNCKVAVFDRIADVKKALIGHLPTIVLLDWNMPDGQGSELCLWIRERWKTLPIVYLTIRGDAHDIVTGFQNGADDYVVKFWFFAAVPKYGNTERQDQRALPHNHPPHFGNQ